MMSICYLRSRGKATPPSVHSRYMRVLITWLSRVVLGGLILWVAFQGREERDSRKPRNNILNAPSTLLHRDRSPVRLILRDMDWFGLNGEGLLHAGHSLRYHDGDVVSSLTFVRRG